MKLFYRTLLFTLTAHIPIAQSRSHTEHIRSNYTLISHPAYQRIMRQSRIQTRQIIHKLQINHSQTNLNQLFYTASQFFLNTPYKAAHPDGEGDWCSPTIKSAHCTHIQQDPIYRTDQFVCSTYVAQLLALIKANNILNYEKNLLSIKYGAAHEPPSTITYYNRNNFTSTDFNRANEDNGLFSNAMISKKIKPYTKKVTVTINHRGWFQQQQSKTNVKQNVRTFTKTDGLRMQKRFNGFYPDQFHLFKPQTIDFRYIPKNSILISTLKQGHLAYKINQQLLDLIPTPSVAEITRDHLKWRFHNKPIAHTLHSGIAVSHLGLLYRFHYKDHDLIYPKIECNDTSALPSCKVVRQYCQNKQGCTKLMFTHATEAYPKNYYFYQNTGGHFFCTAQKPSHFKGKITQCNRIVTMPLTDYLTMKFNGEYRYMNNPSILGVHIEKINVVSLWKRFT